MATRKKVELPDREALEALVAEVNEVLNLKPAIKVSKKMTDEELIEKLKEECDGNVFEIDFEPDDEDDTIAFFSDEAGTAFELLGIDILEGAPPNPDEEEPAEEEPEEEPEEEVKPKGKGKVKETPPAKAAPAKKDKKDKPAPAAKKKEKEAKYTIAHRTVDAIKSMSKKGATMKELSENGPISPYALHCLVAFDVLEVNEGVYKLIK
jgi:hypothetical protein